MIQKCPEQHVCLDFLSPGGEITHVARMTEHCSRYYDGTCPSTGSACNIEKVKEAKKKLKERK